MGAVLENLVGRAARRETVNCLGPDNGPKLHTPCSLVLSRRTSTTEPPLLLQYPLIWLDSRYLELYNNILPASRSSPANRVIAPMFEDFVADIYAGCYIVKVLSRFYNHALFFNYIVQHSQCTHTHLYTELLWGKRLSS